MSDIASILKDIKGLLPESFKKKRVIELCDEISNTISTISLPTLRELQESLREKNFTLSPIVANFGRFAKMNNKSGKDVIDNLIRFNNEILESLPKIKNLSNIHLSDILTKKETTVRDLTLIKLLSDMIFVANYTPDFVYLAINLKDSDSDFSDINLKLKKELIPMYAMVYLAYNGHLSDIIEDIDGITDEKLPDNANPNFVNEFIKNNGNKVNLPASNGFNYNPIYHFRMYLVDRDIKKIEKLRDKKQLVEYKLLLVKTQNNPELVVNLDKQVRVLENELDSIESDIRKLSS